MTAATGMRVFEPQFGRPVPDIINATTPSAVPTGGGRIERCNRMIDDIVAKIEQEGPDSVATVIAEPVQRARRLPVARGLLSLPARGLRTLRVAARR